MQDFTRHAIAFMKEENKNKQKEKDKKDAEEKVYKYLRDELGAKMYKAMFYGKLKVESPRQETIGLMGSIKKEHNYIVNLKNDKQKNKE